MLSLLFCEHWFRYIQPFERLVKGLPGEALALPPSPIEPFERALDRPIVKLPERLHIAPYSVVVVVSLQPSIQAFDKLSTFQMTVLFDPFLYPTAGPLSLLTGRSAKHTPLSLVVREPVPFQSQKGEAALHARMKSAEPYDLGLLRGDFQTKFLQSLR